MKAKRLSKLSYMFTLIQPRDTALPQDKQTLSETLLYPPQTANQNPLVSKEF